MLKKISSKDMGRNRPSWLRSIFHFSFADYYNPANMQFGVLRVLNDDLVDPSSGFDTHPHRDMEIISYVVDGALSHGDSMGNRHTLNRGHVQYMSAGTGVYHSEHNLGDSVLRFLQIWILPDRSGHEPQYGDHRFSWEDRQDAWLHIVSGTEGTAPVKIHQDANIHVAAISPGKSLDFNVGEGRQAYLVLVEGKASIGVIALEARDAMEIVEEAVEIRAEEAAHVLVVEMKKA